MLTELMCDIREVIEAAPKEGKWARLAARADVAWRLGDRESLAKFAALALLKNPCCWRNQLKSIYERLTGQTFRGRSHGVATYAEGIVRI